MRATVFALMVFGASLGAWMAPAQAVDYPFCIKGEEHGNGTGDCNYPSYAACQAAASGTYSYCARNPFYANAYAGSPQNRSRRVQPQQGY